MNTPAKLIIVMVAVAASAAIGFRTLGPATTAAPPNEKAERKEKAPDNRAEQDEHGADRIYITDVKLAAGGVVLVEAGPANCATRCGSTACCSPTRKRWCRLRRASPASCAACASGSATRSSRTSNWRPIESNQSLTVYDLKAPISGHRHRSADSTWRVRLRAEARLHRRGPVDHLGGSCRLSARPQARRIGDEVLIDPEDGGARIRGKVSYVSPIGAPTRSPRWRARWCCRTRTAGSARPVRHGRACFSTEAVEVPSPSTRLRSRRWRTRPSCSCARDDKFEARDVELGDSRCRSSSRSGSACSAGDVYAAKNSFVVKAEIGKGGSA